MFDFIYHPTAIPTRTEILLNGHRVGYIDQEPPPYVFKPGDDAAAMLRAWDPTCTVKVFNRDVRTFPTRAKAYAYLGRLKKI